MSQWSSVQEFVNKADAGTWIPDEDKERILSYLKYDEIYWNDPSQYALRVLEDEQPLYIPKARKIVDTTSHYLLKGLTLECDDQTTKEALDVLLKRERFMSTWETEKQSGIARGDWVYHMTADPNKEQGSRISLEPVHPGNVFPIWDPEDPDAMIGVHLAKVWDNPDDPNKLFMRRLTYRKVVDKLGLNKGISREEVIFEIDSNLWGPKATVFKQTLPLGMLDARITSLPVYWFKNRAWSGQDYGSSELRGLEQIAATISQGSTDVSASLSLEGLGVYATDGGRPVVENPDGTLSEGEWEVAPGKVMEVPQGGYFRRVEGVGSVTPATDQLAYLESKMYEAAGLSDVALGTVDAQVAQSGIALAIRFSPTLAQMETRDKHGIDKLTQMFYDWKTWHAIFEQQLLTGDIVPTIGDKLPIDRIARVNELNNMFDRGLIPGTYYREEMTKIGYKFPDDIEAQLEKEAKKKVEAARAAFLATAPNGAGNGDNTDSSEDGTSKDGNTLPDSGNNSNNAKKPNESSGTEAK